jgi:phospholipase/carboxylesterase
MSSAVPAFHQGRVVRTGAPPHRAKAAMILLHGRGASAEGMLSLADALAQPDIAYLAPQAARGTWYPYSFLAPLADNEPWLSSALQVIADVLRSLAAEGFPPERVGLLGFSQGGCLALEFAARHARRYGAVVGLSAGLIGPEGTPRNYSGSLAGTPAFLGCSDIDPHIPLARVRESTRILRQLGAEVQEQIYPCMDHTINDDEIRRVRGLLARLQNGDK